MSNIKWSGIEQWKYGLTARWYVSAYYGNDTDVDAVGLYDPSTNPTGHGGPTRPFATLDKVFQEAVGVVVIDSGYYFTIMSSPIGITVVGDGIVTLDNFGSTATGYNYSIYNCISLNAVSSSRATSNYTDSFVLYSNVNSGSTLKNTIFIECALNAVQGTSIFENVTLTRCSGTIGFITVGKLHNVLFKSCEDFIIKTTLPRPIGLIMDYSIIIGAVKTSVAINGKTTGVTIEDFKADGNYFTKSYSEVDLFGNASGSGATVSQLNEIFNNFYYPYIDDYHNLDLTLRPDCDERVRFGGLNGTYIGALPVGYRLSASELWNTHIDTVNTSNLDFDMVNNAIVLASGQDVGTYTSLIIDLGVPVTVDMVDFLANFVYNIEGTAKQGVSNQRIDTTPDLLPDNTENQRVVYDYRLQYSPDGVTALTDWENMELNRMPTIDGAGLYQLEDGFNQATAQKLTIQRLKLEFTLRRVIIA